MFSLVLHLTTLAQLLGMNQVAVGDVMIGIVKLGVGREGIGVAGAFVVIFRVGLVDLLGGVVVVEVMALALITSTR